MLFTQLLAREAKDFSMSDKHSRHVPLLTYLAWLQLIINNSRLISKHAKTKDALVVVKSFMKNGGDINQQPWISSHFNQLAKVIIKNFSLRKYISELLFQKYILKLLPQKMHFKTVLPKNTFQNCYHKDIFINASIKAAKLMEADGDKSLIMHD